MVWKWAKALYSRVLFIKHRPLDVFVDCIFADDKWWLHFSFYLVGWGWQGVYGSSGWEELTPIFSCPVCACFKRDWKTKFLGKCKGLIAKKVIVPIASTISRSRCHRYWTRYLVRFITRGTKTACSVIPGKRELSALIVFEHALSRHNSAHACMQVYYM